MPEGKTAIVAAPLDADLLLLLTGKDIANGDTSIYAIFRHYPKSRHNTPMSAAESKRGKKVKPKVMAKKSDALEAAIEIASEGIYEFRASSEGNGTQAEECSLTIEGSTKRKKVKRLDSKRLGSDSSIVRVMMPEGILWDDDSQFSGSIEDSESITKYNSESGFVWKEYR